MSEEAQGAGRAQVCNGGRGRHWGDRVRMLQREMGAEDEDP